MAQFVTIRLEGLSEYMATLDPKHAKAAIRPALKRMTDMVKTEASTTIRRDYAIKKVDLDPFMKLQLRQLQSEISVTGKPISLLYFGAKQLTSQNRVVSAKGGKQLKRKSRNLGQGTTPIYTCSACGVAVRIRDGQSPQEAAEKAGFRKCEPK